MMKITALVGAATLALASAGFVPAQAAEGPFGNFSGAWSGTGTVTVKNGTKERLRCKAHYEVSGGGEAMAQNLTCASDSYTFNVVANVKANGGSVSGNWPGTSRGPQGGITGRPDPKQI